MTWRRAAELARDWADQARHKADQQPASQLRVAEIDQGDRPALVAWLQRRIAQEFERFAAECHRRSSVEDPTVLERGPRR